MELKEIGRIYSPYKTVKEAPRQGKISDKFCEIEIFPAYETALLHADEGRYYVVLYFAHEADRTALQTVPPPGQRNLTAYLPAVRRTGRIPSIYAWSNW